MSSLLGILIPPSITMILFGVVTRQSITALFAASIGPGLLLLVGLVLYNRFMAGRMFQEEYLSDDLGVERTRWSTFKKAIPALILPVIILGSIYGGIATPTEAASIAVICAILIGIFVYREMSLKHLKDSIIAAGETTGTIMLILLFSFMIGKILTAERVPQELTEAITGMVQNPIMILLLVNGFLIAAGMIMDDLSVTVVIAPLLLPSMTSVGVDPVHYGTIVACSVVIAANSPPVAPILYMACRIGQVSIHRALVPAILQIIFVGIPVLAITTFVPFVSLAIPRLLGVY
ncbi:trap dicarboxylate transporter, dctm subunit [Citreicella sp. SE45]|nr:trap dicarboxylate transporter, dctm subunit [Citreicella sp. SE45]